jgi:RimJ/RimL family protein N-acetyltransferase
VADGGRDVVRLAAVDDDVLERMVRAALDEAAANEVTPPVTPGEEWTPERVAWLRSFHRSRRAGLDGPDREATWAVLADGVVVGAARLKRVPETASAEVGIWLTRRARGRGVGRDAVRAVLDEARASSVSRVRADTTAANGAALGVLRGLGFECTPVDDGAVIAWLALDG